MSLPAGTTIALSPMRRIVCDMMHASRKVPLVAIEREFDLAPLVTVWKGLDARPSYFAMFLKAYSLVCNEHPELRRSFLTFPGERLHQHHCNVANLPIAREIDGEEAVLGILIRHPEKMPLAEIDSRIREARTRPIDEIADFRRLLRLGRLPTWIRRFAWWLGLNCNGHWRARHLGTFLITSIGALGSASLNVLSPLTTSIAYGALKPNGALMVRLFYDHRVLDGVQPARALAALEKALVGPILAELEQSARAKRLSNISELQPQASCP